MLASHRTSEDYRHCVGAFTQVPTKDKLQLHHLFSCVIVITEDGVGYSLKSKIGANKMTQWVKVFAVKPDYLSLIPGI